MGKIQVGQKSPKTVDMGGFTVASDVITPGTNNGSSVEGKESLQDGHVAGDDANGHDEVPNETLANGDESAKNEVPAEEGTMKKNKKA